MCAAAVGGVGGVGSLDALAGVAAARSPWRPPVALTAHGVVANGWLAATGVFRSAGELAGRPHLTTVSASGAVTGGGVSASDVDALGLRGDRTLAIAAGDPVRLAVLDRRGVTLRRAAVRGHLPALLGFDIPAASALPGGGAIVCTDLTQGRGEEIAVVSPDGSAVHTTRLRPVPAAPATSPTGGCLGTTAAPTGPPRGAVIEENADAVQGSGATDAQVLVQRVTPGTTPAAPVPVVPTGEMFTVNAGEPQVTETSSGWIAVSWLPSQQRGRRLLSHQNLRWVSPAGRLGPVIGLTAPSASIPPAVTLAATGPRAAVALIAPEAPDRVIESASLRAPGHVGPRRTLYTGSRIVVPRIAGDGRALVAAWSDARGVHASRFAAGRWSSPALVKRCAGFGGAAVCPNAPGVTMSPTGRAAIWFSLVGPNPLRAGGEVVLQRR